MILKLTLKKKWFNMIASGEKKEEYREIKNYYMNRLTNKYEQVLFTNGYRKDSPKLLVECLWIGIGKGITEWGAEKGKNYFVIKLGNILSIKE